MTDIHSPSHSQVQAALGKVKCGIHLTGISAGFIGPELVRTAPAQNGCGQQQARIDADNTERELVLTAPSQNGCGQRGARMGAGSTGAVIGAESTRPELV